MLGNGEWRLSYPGVDLVFGTASHEVFLLATPDLGDVELRTADAANARRDGVSFGVDYLGGRTITFDLGVRGESEAAVRSSLAALAAAWRADAVRSRPGAVATLAARYRDEDRVVFGRPRHFAQVTAEARTARFASVVADFACADDRFYSAEEHEVTVSIVPAPQGGLEAPLASPLSTTESSDRSVGFTVAGDSPAWPVIVVEGPISSPVVEVVGRWRLEFDLTLDYDHTLTIDASPWARTVLRDGAGVWGSLSRTSSRLAETGLPPGDYEFVLRGESTTGTALARLRWRDSYSTL